MKIFITGGCGFLGSNLAQSALSRGHELSILDDLSRLGSRDNLDWLKTRGPFAFTQADTRDASAVSAALADFRPQAVFHLAGQVAMTTSLSNPRRDFETNVLGGFNVLEAVRLHAPEAAIVYSSTNKVYGELEGIVFDETPTRYVARGKENGFDESVPLSFQSPYGCSKGAVDQYMLDYSRMFGVRAVVFRHSSIFGGRQYSTFDQGWIGWFAAQAVAAAAGRLTGPVSVAGNGKQVRDVLFASDIVECYFSALAAIDKTAGQAFNIGGGAPNSLSILELFALLEKITGAKPQLAFGPPRLSDQKVFIADTAKALRLFGWTPRVRAEDGLRSMIEWIKTLER